ncbi:hypothetical protein [Onishia taeanensis]
MHSRDSGTWLKAAPSSAHASTLASALALTLVIGWGVTDAPFPASQGALTERAVALPTHEPTGTSPSGYGGGHDWREGQEAREYPWRAEAGGDSVGFDASACLGDCAKALRQRLLDYHRQAAPVWVF